MKPKELRYRAYAEDVWTIVKMPHRWNDTEKAFVAILDAAFPDDVVVPRAVEKCTIPNFGLKVVTESIIIYYAGDVAAATVRCPRRLCMSRYYNTVSVADWG